MLLRADCKSATHCYLQQKTTKRHSGDRKHFPGPHPSSFLLFSLFSLPFLFYLTNICLFRRLRKSHLKAKQGIHNQDSSQFDCLLTPVNQQCFLNLCRVECYPPPNELSWWSSQQTRLKTEPLSGSHILPALAG